MKLWALSKQNRLVSYSQKTRLAKQICEEARVIAEALKKQGFSVSKQSRKAIWIVKSPTENLTWQYFYLPAPIADWQIYPPASALAETEAIKKIIFKALARGSGRR